MKSRQNNIRLKLLFTLLLIIPLGLYTKFYTGIYQNWVNNSLCGIYYTIFWIVLISLILPKRSTGKISLIVFIFTSVLEFLQLWHPKFLMIIREYFLGRTLIGTSFNWTDFIYYLVGCIVGFMWVSGIKKAPASGA
ncbi:DUF2809 domain-containing protein [Candidatus Cloacimonadota bacterium]